jgi:hypothetical protein
VLVGDSFDLQQGNFRQFPVLNRDDIEPPRRTIVENKAKQKRSRSEAEAKQERYLIKVASK